MTDQEEARSVNLMQATYADILFILLPFLAMLMQRWWNGEPADVIMRAPDLSIAATVLAGLAIGKFVLGLISDPGLARYKERIVFFIAISLFFCLGPGLILILKIVGQSSVEDVPELVTFVQPVLLMIAITLYSAAVNVGNLFSGIDDAEENVRPQQDEDNVFDFSALGTGSGQRERDSD